MSKSIERNIASVNKGADEFTTGLKQLAQSAADAINNKHIQEKPIEFFGTADNGIYGKGLQWTGVGQTKYLVLNNDPDRLWSNVSIDLKTEQSYMIDNTPVLSANELGRTVTKSNLRQVGTLNNLVVSGNLNVSQFVIFDSGLNRLGIGTDTPNATLSVASNTVEFIVQPGVAATDIGTHTNSGLNIKTDSTDRITITANGNITLGLKGNTETKINMYGRVGIGVTSVESDVSLSTSGAVKFQNKKFEVGSGIPVAGAYTVGDIIWNSAPSAGAAIGWVCVATGNPGQWKSFGTISN
jgi:hypothetical protein